MPNETYNIKEIIVGNYPIEDNDVLIGEYVASAYMNKNDLTDYNQLINKEIIIELNDSMQTLRISGVYSGGENLIVSNQNQAVKNIEPKEIEVSLYKKFNSKKEKEEFIATNLKTNQYIDSSSNTIDIFKYIKLMIIILINFIFILFNYGILRKYYIILKHHDIKNKYLMYTGVIANLILINYLILYLIYN